MQIAISLVAHRLYTGTGEQKLQTMTLGARHRRSALPTKWTSGTLVLLVMYLSLSASARALPGDLSSEDKKIGVRPGYTRCLDASEGVTPVMRDCISEEMGHQDDRLNRAYRALMANLDPAAKHQLRIDERAWIRKRDSLCALDPDSGQGGELDAYACSVDKTTERAFELEMMLKR